MPSVALAALAALAALFSCNARFSCSAQHDRSERAFYKLSENGFSADAILRVLGGFPGVRAVSAHLDPGKTLIPRKKGVSASVRALERGLGGIWGALSALSEREPCDALSARQSSGSDVMPRVLRER